MKNVLIIGLKIGRHIAMQLNQLGHELWQLTGRKKGWTKCSDLWLTWSDRYNIWILQSLLGMIELHYLWLLYYWSFQRISLERTGSKLEYPELNVMSMKNFFYAMVQIRWFIREKQVAKWHLSVTQMIISLIIWRCGCFHAIFEVEVPRNGLGKTVGGLDIRSVTILFWQ